MILEQRIEELEKKVADLEIENMKIKEDIGTLELETAKAISQIASEIYKAFEQFQANLVKAIKDLFVCHTNSGGVINHNTSSAE